MFKNTYHSGFLSLFYSLGSQPLQLWEQKADEGEIKFVIDNEIQSQVLELEATNLHSNYIACPPDPRRDLHIDLPVFVMIIKNMNQYFSFEIQITDDKFIRRRFRASNYQKKTRIKPFICTIPLKLDDGWNIIRLNLAELTQKTYGSRFVHFSRIQIHSNCRIRRIFFAEKFCSEDEMPIDLRLFAPEK
eukprot:TRINITY_DN5625_c1_g1_i1.p1 TRINITY_DN5625_c1_g1~~TRINITY_DN5625_c1_g1_i1.p1  ORF type:complete len:189 (-),score=66.56 TRINITY_DN5625_c1_g1_i1:77-643(-)